MSVSTSCLSHKTSDPGEAAFESIKQRLTSRAELDTLEQLNAFDLGRFLISHRGLNGFWTSYIVNKGVSPLLARHVTLAARAPLENWLLEECPPCVATQQRFVNFRKELQLLVRPGRTIASVPCGVMDDLLTLDYSQAPDVQLVGVDIDPESLKLAAENAEIQGLQDRASFLQQDAWTFGEDESFDVITSSGLNIYEPGEARVIELYRNFHRVLKPGGYLLTSFLTPPVMGNKPSPWKNVKLGDLLKAKLVFRDVLDVKWQVFHTEAEFRDILKQARFAICDVLFDEHRMFPTVLAQKA